jgi:uncharacterized RDD family membrane protein YckC
VIRICPKCRALLLEDTENCSFCDVSLDSHAETQQPIAVAAAASSSAYTRAVTSRQARIQEALVQETNVPDWRQEVARRLEDYRARRGRLRPDDPQSGLPFHEEIPLEEDEDEIRGQERVRTRPSQRQRQTERMEICIQPEFDFASSPDDRAHPQTALVPVASISDRRWAGILDALFLGLTCAGFFGLFRSLGGEMLLDKMDAIVYSAVAFLFYAQYFFLFTTFAGATPGMQLRGLTIVRLDGSLPDTRQLLWRSFGYILSGATLMLGYLWALWDEDHFTWHDRISQTYITAATPVEDSGSLPVPPARRSFAHR